MQKKAKRLNALLTGGIRESLTIIIIPAVKRNKPQKQIFSFFSEKKKENICFIP